MSKGLVIIGAGGHGKVIADIAKRSHYDPIVFLDDNDKASSCGDYPVAGRVDRFIDYPDHDFVVAIGNPAIRRRVQTRLEEARLSVAALVHPNAVVAEDVRIGAGSVVMACAVINPGTVIGKGCIINTAASVDHDNQLADYVHVSVGARTAGTVLIGENTMLGAGAVVINNVSVCADCMIGAGAVVVGNIEEKGTYIGVPARLMK